jgi:hypothetical protein
LREGDNGIRRQTLSEWLAEWAADESEPGVVRTPEGSYSGPFPKPVSGPVSLASKESGEGGKHGAETASGHAPDEAPAPSEPTLDLGDRRDVDEAIRRMGDVDFSSPRRDEDEDDDERKDLR